MKKSKIVLSALSLAIAASLMVGCAAKAPAPAPSAPAASSPEASAPAAPESSAPAPAAGTKVLKVGVDDSLTGTGAPYGLPGANAVKLAAKQLNADGGIQIGPDKYTIELVVYDNKSDASEGVSTIQKLMDIDKVQFVLGWSSSTATLAAAQTIKGKDMTLIIGNARSPMILTHSTGNLWRSATVNCYDPVADCEYIKSLGVNKVAVLAFMNDTAYNVHVNNVIEAFKKIGVEVTTVENFNAGDTDMLPQMTKISVSGAEGLYMAGNIEESATALRQLRELGSDIPLFTFSSGTGPQWLEICTNEQMAGAYTIRPNAADPGSENDKEARAFIAAYEAEYGINPSQTATNTYDNFWILMAAYQKAGTTEYQAVNKALGELAPADLDPRTIIKYDTLSTGKLFDDLGQAYQAYHVCKWGETEKNWVYEATIGKDLGPDFYHNYLANLPKK